MRGTHEKTCLKILDIPRVRRAILAGHLKFKDGGIVGAWAAREMTDQLLGLAIKHETIIPCDT